METEKSEVLGVAKSAVWRLCCGPESTTDIAEKLDSLQRDIDLIRHLFGLDKPQSPTAAHRAKISSDGRITLPETVRQKAGICGGQTVTVTASAGQIVIRSLGRK